jgi:AraC-like DNA-binding protein
LQGIQSTKKDHPLTVSLELDSHFLVLVVQGPSALHKQVKAPSKVVPLESSWYKKKLANLPIGWSLFVGVVDGVISLRFRLPLVPLDGIEGQAFSDPISRRKIASGLKVGIEGVEDPLLERFESYVLAHVDSFDLTSDKIAAALEMSKSGLYRKIKKKTGKTINQLVNEIKYDYIYREIQQGRVDSVKAAAYSIGVKDVAYFSRVFEKRFGDRPADLLNPIK